MRTASGKEVILDEMRPSELFGELAALDGVKRSANVSALTRGEACVMPAAGLQGAALLHPGRRRAPLLPHGRAHPRAERAASWSRRCSICGTGSIPNFCACPRRAATGAGERVITPPPFHHIVAARIGCRREQVTREFTMLTQEGLIERTRGALILRQPEILKARVAEAMREDA